MYILIINIIAVLFLSVAVIFPAVFFIPNLSAEFLRSVWPMAVLAVLALACMNIYFFKNRRLFDLLKREDWPALADYLEKKVYKDGKFSTRNVKLLAHSYFVLGDFSAVARLEDKTTAVKPVLLDEFALIFGSARLLGGNSADAAEFFKTRLENGKINNSQRKQWLCWFYGFSLLISGSYDKARVVFGELVLNANDGIITGLSAYILSETLGKRPLANEECQNQAKKGVEKVWMEIKTLDIWKRKAEKVQTEIHGAVIKNKITEAGEWLFKKEIS